MPGPPVDLAGKKHFRATILRIERVGVRGARYWRCRCTCGAEYVKSEGELINRIGRSCGKCENAKAHIPVGVVLRAEARARGDASYDPRVPCKHGHLARRSCSTTNAWHVSERGPVNGCATTQSGQRNFKTGPGNVLVVILSNRKKLAPPVKLTGVQIREDECLGSCFLREAPDQGAGMEQCAARSDGGPAVG